jgi:hypothetical protein
MKTFFKVLIAWADKEHSDSMEFFFSSKERAEEFEKKFKEDLEKKEYHEIAKKYKINHDTCDDMCCTGNVTSDVCECLMDEKFE